MLGMGKMPEAEFVLHAIVVPQFRKTRELQPEFVNYDRALEGSEQTRAQYMLDSARQTVSRRRRANTEAAMLGSRVQVTLNDCKGKDKGNKVMPKDRAKAKEARTKIKVDTFVYSA